MTSYLALVRADLELALFGLQRVVGELPAVAARTLDAGEAKRMAEAVARVKRAALSYRPGARCLPQAVAITRLLRRAGYPVTLVVAVRRFPFAAHAWVECAGEILTDRQEVKREFRPILVSEPELAPIEAKA